MKKILALTALALLLAASSALAQLGQAPPYTTTLTITIGPEIAFSVDSGTTLTSTGRFADFLGSTNFTYYIRTTVTGGGGSINLYVSSDFGSCSGTGPCVAAPKDSETLKYSCSVNNPGNHGTATGCTASTPAAVGSANATPVVSSFSTDARSLKAGNTGVISWDLSNSPMFQTGSPQATVTYVISAT